MSEYQQNHFLGVVVFCLDIITYHIYLTYVSIESVSVVNRRTKHRRSNEITLWVAGDMELSKVMRSCPY